jgi:hypothetical protein
MKDRLDNGAAGIVKLLKNKHVAHLESVERQKRWEEERRAKEDEEVRRRHELARSRKLVRLASSADRSAKLTHFVSELFARAVTSARRPRCTSAETPNSISDDPPV